MKQKRLVTIPVSEIYKALLRSPASKSLRSNLRYDPFRHHSEDAKLWLKILGPSAVTYSHMKHIYRLTRKTLTQELKLNHKKFSLAEQEMLLLAALSHDFGEALLDQKSVGDVPAPLKRARHEKIEQDVYKQVIKSLQIEPSLKTKLLKSYLDVCHNKNSRLYKFFHLVEHIDYIDTGIRTYRNLVADKYELKRGKHLIGQILTFSVPVLTHSANGYASVEYFLRTRESEIHGMFKYCIAEYRDAEKLKQVVLGVDAALSKWQNFIES